MKTAKKKIVWWPVVPILSLFRPKEDIAMTVSTGKSSILILMYFSIAKTDRGYEDTFNRLFVLSFWEKKLEISNRPTLAIFEQSLQYSHICRGFERPICEKSQKLKKSCFLKNSAQMIIKRYL